MHKYNKLLRYNFTYRRINVDATMRIKAPQFFGGIVLPKTEVGVYSDADLATVIGKSFVRGTLILNHGMKFNRDVTVLNGGIIIVEETPEGTVDFDTGVKIESGGKIVFKSGSNVEIKTMEFSEDSEIVVEANSKINIG